MRRVLLAVALVMVSCGGDEDVITVFAAASLTDAFTEIAAAFEAGDGGEVELSFAGSSALREQIASGAPADVFASADRRDEGTPFATSSLAIAVPRGNEAGITGLEDFADRDLLLGLCAAEVPCGALAREALDRAGVTPVLDTEEPDVRALLAKVEAGELDAGIVYVTDVRTAEVDRVDVPAEHDVVTPYPIAAITDEGRPFVDFVLSAAGQAILRDHGFGAP